ncbi:hypothetical protein BDF19DRAFT_415676 [Syncephalis fuscata]|nr:hypothetical protein BDF19DRAFT_415676 [Syncephalis fuscata]
MSKLSLITDPTTRTLAGVLAATGAHASQTIDRIITHFACRIELLECELKSANATRARIDETVAANELPANKKRRPASPPPSQASAATTTTSSTVPSVAIATPMQIDNNKEDQSAAVLTVKTLSFTVPRKKLDLELTQNGVRLRRSNQTVETSFSYSCIRDVFCLPTPGRPTSSGPHWTIVFILPLSTTNSNINTNASSATLKGDVEIVAFGFGDAETLSIEPAANTTESTSKNCSFIIKQLEQWTGHSVKGPSSGFNPISTNKSNALPSRSYVNCHLKTRDGYLFFLDHGLFFGFRKPVLYLPLTDIAQVSVATITSRTFSLCITLKQPEQPIPSTNSVESSNNKKEKDRMVEFAMIDAGDFEPIVAYVRWAKLEAPELYQSPNSNSNSSQATNKDASSTAGAKAKTNNDTLSATSQMLVDNVNGDDDDDDEDDEDFCIGSESEDDDDDSIMNLMNPITMIIAMEHLNKLFLCIEIFLFKYNCF